MEFYKTKNTPIELIKKADDTIDTLMEKIAYIKKKINLVREVDPLLLAYYIDKLEEGIEALTFHYNN